MDCIVHEVAESDTTEQLSLSEKVLSWHDCKRYLLYSFFLPFFSELKKKVREEDP